MKRGIKYFVFALILYIIISAVYLITEKDSNKITANAVSGDTLVQFEVLPFCYVPLENGWNLISFCVNLTNKSVENALSRINTSYRYVMEWNESSQGFLIYSPLSSSNPFTEFDEKKSYFIYFTETNSTKLPGQGAVFGDLNLSLLFGWNTPTYPYEFNTNITKYLATIQNRYRYMMRWNVSRQEFLIYSPLSAVHDFDLIRFGEGQFIYIRNATGAYLLYNRTDLQ